MVFITHGQGSHLQLNAQEFTYDWTPNRRQIQTYRVNKTIENDEDSSMDYLHYGAPSRGVTLFSFNQPYNQMYNQPQTTHNTLLVKNQQITQERIQFSNLRRNSCYCITSLVFKKCKFTFLPQNVYDQLNNLTILELDQCEITNLTRQNLKGFERLQQICIINSGIEKIEADLFDDIIGLEVIELCDNKITEIDVKCFVKHRDSLKCIDLRNTKTFNAVYANPTYGFDQKGSFECFDNFDEFINHIQMKQNQNNSAGNSGETLNFLSDIRKALANENLKDFTITICDENFKVHKLILAARCPLFAEMISNNPDAESLNLVDIPIEIFKIILNYIYNDEMPKDDGNLREIFAAAGRLKLEHLKNFTGRRILDVITSENAYEVLVLANKYQHDELKLKAFEEVKKFFPDKKIKDEMIDDVENLGKLVEAKRKMDREIQMMKEKFDKMSKMFE